MKHNGSLLLLGNLTQGMPQQNLSATVLQLSHSQMPLLLLSSQPFPETGGGSGLVWFSTVLAIDLLIPCEHKNSPPPTSTLARAPAASRSATRALAASLQLSLYGSQ